MRRANWNGQVYMVSADLLAGIVRLAIQVTEPSPATAVGRKVWITLTPERARRLSESLARSAESAAKRAVKV